MAAPHERPAGWTIEDAEHLLGSLTGVVSARVVTRPGGGVDEIHVLTTTQVAPKQTVRNVESALLAHLDLDVDHRKISVAQSNQVAPIPLEGGDEPMKASVPREGPRLVFHSHGAETERGRKVRHRVEIGWKSDQFLGEATAADLPRSRLEAVAKATLRAIEAVLGAALDEEAGSSVTLALDGVRMVDAFERRFVLVAVNATAGRDFVPLAGVTIVDESSDRATILATLHATNRWVRGRI